VTDPIKSPARLGVIAFAVLAINGITIPAVAQEALLEAFFSDLPTDPQALADKIMGDVAAIRGLEFTSPISVSDQTQEEFESYLAKEMERTLPDDRAGVFGRVISKLGLYKGPVIENSVELITLLATSQAAAYYDPDSSAFYVLLSDASIALLAPIYAHELYHGLQDQYWDLNAYVLDGIRDGLNDDEMLARQAVVEGEATYIMTLWTLREITGTVPSGFMLDLAIQTQTQMDSKALRDMAMSGVVPGALNESIQASIDAMDQIPLFMMETMIGVYLKGMGFVHQIVKNGWAEGGRLYTDPPSSTEQILHPEKWLDRDEPVRIKLPDFGSVRALDGWTLLDTNVIGEFQMRIIFSEFDMASRSAEIAAGWDGDRYAVFERNGELLLLLYTTWDDASEAAEFAQAYQDLLTTKYAGRNETTAVQVTGSDVLIVEGGAADQAQGFLDLLATASKD
jgi:hypothetical protein